MSKNLNQLSQGTLMWPCWSRKNQVNIILYTTKSNELEYNQCLFLDVGLFCDFIVSWYQSALHYVMSNQGFKKMIWTCHGHNLRTTNHDYERFFPPFSPLFPFLSWALATCVKQPSGFHGGRHSTSHEIISITIVHFKCAT